MDAGANHECRVGDALPIQGAGFGVHGKGHRGQRIPKVGVVNIGAERRPRALPLQIDAGALLKSAGEFHRQRGSPGLAAGQRWMWRWPTASPATSSLKLSEGLGKSFGGAIKDLFKQSLLTKIGYLCVRGLDGFRKEDGLHRTRRRACWALPSR